MGQAWHEIVVEALKANDIRLIPYVPDNVLKPLITAIHADPFFTAFTTAREEEAVGIVAGAWHGRHARHGADADQRLRHAGQRAGLPALPYQIPLLMLVSRARHAGRVQHRPGGGLAHHAAGARSRSAMEHHVITRLDEMRVHRRPHDQAGGG